MLARTDQMPIRPLAAAASYFALVLFSVGAIWVALAEVGARYTGLQAAETMLARLEGRAVLGSKSGQTAFAGAPPGSPFLEGQTLTVAGAALLQRVAGVVNRVGGNVLSSQVDLKKADATDGWIGLTVSCDLEQSTLQTVLYDLEAGMPFLFVDQLVVTARMSGVEENRVHIVLAVSALWRAGK